MNIRKIIIQSCIGFSLAVLVVWGIGSLTLTSPTLYEYSSDWGFALRAEGSFKQQRGENWVCCDYGKMGLEKSEQAKIDSSKPKCVIYGDSYIEAVMIPGKNRVQNQVKLEPYDVLGFGFSGISAIEYTYLMKKTQENINNVAYHIILVGDITDIKNISPVLCDGKHTGSLPYHSSSRLERYSYLFRLYAFRTMLRRWRLYQPDYLGNHWRNRKDDDKKIKMSDINGVCKALKTSAGNIPLLIVYAPKVPYIDKNRLLFTDKNAVFARQLENACKENQIDFLNMGPIFCQDFKKSNKFPRGFFNTPPGEGHMNSHGHKLLANVIAQHLSGE